ncbi:MAG: hypothetical protein KDD33_02970 [Bdellovibrionales bacterium]|nr:hypothetical protein [Bdellovibrionales bacterium]
MSKISLYILSVFILIFSVSCTGKRNNAALSFKISKQSKVQAQSLGLTYVAVNIRQGSKSSKPIATFSADAEDSGWSATEDIEISFDELPSGATFIQFMGAYEIAGGGMDFAYAMQELDLEPGDNVASLVAHFVASSTRQATIAGRYLTDVSSGPTGTLVMEFQPPNDDPVMEIQKNEIFNGWFRIFALESSTAGLRYRVEESGEILFGGPVNVSDFDSKVSQKVVHAHKPLTYSSYGDEEREAEEVFLGFFAAEGVTLPSQFACYSSLDEGILNVFVDAAKTQLLVFDADAVAPSLDEKLYVSGGGELSSYSDYYFSANCNDAQVSAGNAIRLYHHQLSSGIEGMTGIQGPFLAAYPHQPYDHFSKTSYDSVGNSVSIEWTYLPGINSTIIGGASLYYSFHSGDDFHVDDEDGIPCDEVAESAGFTFLDETTSNSLTGLSVPDMTSSNMHNVKFLVCPYKEENGERRYYASGLEVHGINDRGSALEDQHFGWSAQAATSFGQSNFTDVQMGGDHFVVDGKTDLTTTTKLSHPSHGLGKFSDGDEVLVVVISEYNDGCGVEVDPGSYLFTRILRVSGATNIDVEIPRGTWVDSLIPANLNNSHSPGSTHCEVQVVKVPHFTDLTINSAVNHVPYDKVGNNGGGIIAFRVSGTLTMNNDIIAKGFMGTATAGDYGAGNLGKIGSSTTGSGGLAALSGGGGGGGSLGAGGSASVASGGGAVNLPNNANYPFLLGGGGGGDGTYSANGGGAIFIAAKTINATGVRYLKSTADVPTGNAGGGGGGSVHVIAHELIGNKLIIAANGTNGSGSGSGGGGGGLVKLNYCTNSLTGASPALMPQAYGGGAATGGSNGADGQVDENSNTYFCN